MTESKADVIDLISTLLDSGKFKEAINIPDTNEYKDSFKNNCWDLISVVTEKIQDDTIIIKPSLYGACEQMLSIIVDKGSPEESLLEFIERIELAKNDAQFGITLPPLQHVLKKLIAKRGRSLEWCLNSISTYIEKIPIGDHHLEGDERKLMDSDPNIRRITKVYSVLPSFYQCFIDEYLNAEKPNIKTKQIIAAFLISLMGKPMIFIDIDPNANEKSEARMICNTLIQDICRLEKNVLKYLAFVEVCSKEENKSKSVNFNNEEDIEREPYEHREKINMITLSNLYYIVYSGCFELPVCALPQVYNNEYINYILLHAVNHLLSYSEYGPISKALALSETVNTRLADNTSHTLLSSSIYFVLCKNLVSTSIYCNYITLRKDALRILGIFINKFNNKGRCILIKYLIETANHSGMIGYVIGEYKKSLNESFSKQVLDDCFKGAELTSIIKKMCHLPHGAETDLMEFADQIIATLNFLRFLVIKDTNNVSGIKDMYPFIETEYVETLRTALKMSRAHYELKLKDLKEGKKLPEEEETNVTLNVAGSILKSIPTENKQKVLESALNGFDLMEYLIARLSEFMKI